MYYSQAVPFYNMYYSQAVPIYNMYYSQAVPIIFSHKIFFSWKFSNLQ